MFMQTSGVPVMPVRVTGVPVPMGQTTVPQVGGYVMAQPLTVFPGCKKKKKCKVHDESSDEEETIIIKREPQPQVIHKKIIVQQPPPQPKIVIVPQPAPEEPKKRDVIVYAPQVIQANKSLKNYQMDDRDTSMVDVHPFNSTFNQLNDGRLYDSRADNRVNYNRQNWSQADYRADQRSFRNAEDNRRIDYRADNRMAMAYTPGYDYYCDDDNYARGYYNGQTEAYNGYDDYPYYPSAYYP